MPVLLELHIFLHNESINKFYFFLFFRMPFLVFHFIYHPLLIDDLLKANKIGNHGR